MIFVIPAAYTDLFGSSSLGVHFMAFKKKIVPFCISTFFLPVVQLQPFVANYRL